MRANVPVGFKVDPKMTVHEYRTQGLSIGTIDVKLNVRVDYQEAAEDLRRLADILDGLAREQVQPT